MNCELCGNEMSRPKEVLIEGSKLKVCQECAKYGKEVFSSQGGDTSRTEIMNRIQREKRRRESRSVYGGGEEKELALDYPSRIKEARLNNDLTQEELSDKINEKKSVVTKLEKGDLHPSDKLRNKLEHALEIDLMEEVQEFVPNKKNKSSGLTLGDLIKEE